MAQPGFESRFICFQSPCFLIYVGLPSGEKERERERERERENSNTRGSLKKTSASVLAMSSGPRLQRSLELAGTGGRWGERTPFPSLPGLSLLGKLGQARWAQIPELHTRAGEAPLAGSPDSFRMHKDALLCQSWLVVLSGMATLPIPLDLGQSSGKHMY